MIGNTQANVYPADIAQPGQWQALAEGCDLVLHTAAVVSNSAPLELYRKVSVGSVRHTLDAAIAGGARRFVHLSSIAAYGLNFTSQRQETDTLSLLSGYPYCDAKAASEHPVLAAHSAGEIACTIIRPGDVYGPGSRPWVLIPLQMIRKHQFLLPAKGRGIFSPVYIDNLIDGIVTASAHPAAEGQIFNITDGVSVTCSQFFTHHWRWAGKEGSPTAVPTLLANKITRAGEWLLNDVLKQSTEINMGSLAMLCRKAGYSIAKAELMLNYEPKITLSEGMARTEQWLRDTHQ